VLSQVGRQWPADGRIIGIVVSDTETDGVADVRAAILAAGMVPMIIAPHGGAIGALTVQRTFGAARSIEFDALLLASAPDPAPDAYAVRDFKSGAPGTTGVDPRVSLLVDECWRHAKAIGGWGPGARLLRDTGLDATPGVVVHDTAAGVLAAVQELMASHQVWERFPATVA
jgi:catalase